MDTPSVKNVCFVFKGKGKQNEGELLYVEQYLQGETCTGGYVMNVLTDMYSNRIEEEVNRILKKKETITQYEPLSFKLLPVLDWRGH